MDEGMQAWTNELPVSWEDSSVTAASVDSPISYLLIVHNITKELLIFKNHYYYILILLSTL